MICVLSAGRDAPAELRARLAFGPDQVAKLLRSRPDGVAEMVVLCTCHRTEIYVVPDGTEVDAVHAIASLLPLQASDREDLRFCYGLDAVDHLFRVTCGLESLVVGEPQIAGQVRRALATAEEEDASGPTLRNVFGRALRLGRRARTDTALGRIGASIGTVVASHLDHRLHGLEGRSGLIVGAGEAATDVAHALAARGARLAFAGRTLASVRRLASSMDAAAHPIDEVPRLMEHSDFAVLAVSGGALVSQDVIPPRPFVAVDVSTPPAVTGVSRQDIDVLSLEDLPAPGGPDVSAAIAEADVLVRAEVEALGRWYDGRPSGPAIRDLREHAERIVRAEVARSLGREATADEVERATALGMRIVNKLLHGPSVALRDGDETARDVIRRVFELGL